LKAYINYAKNGPSRNINNDMQNTIHSVFEHSVYNFLVDRGFNVVTNVGQSGYKIDMAIQSPEDKSIYTLGIECDGEFYRSARTARERDRLRETVLKEMGWTLYRIWSTEWIRHPDIEKKRLLLAAKDSQNKHY
jgi:very-short-patch-repair endonuclease